MGKIKRRDGTTVSFDSKKIYRALERALQATGEDTALAQKIGEEVIAILQEKFEQRVPHVEDVQDAVEKQLIAHGKYETAKAYILYRQSRAEIRQRKQMLGIKDTLKLSLNSLRVLRERYLRRHPDTDEIETPVEMFRRVANAVAQADALYGEDPRETEEKFFQAMVALEFLPNSPALMNAGTDLGQLSACFVLPIADSLTDIFDTLKQAALIHQSGGGTGFSFSSIRPRGDPVKSTDGVASGPVSFMKIFDRATEIIKQGGKRRGANMGILSVYHPDILDFIRVKEREGVLSNFNISVSVTDEFMTRVLNNQKYDIINPRTNKPVKQMNARDVFDLIIMNAWQSGDPGLIFIDEINRHNPVPGAGAIEATNPCGEVPLAAFESCNLGSINLVKMCSGGKFDYQTLGEVVRVAVHFLDNVIDVNRYPLPQVEKMTKANRKVGLGIMGFADCLIDMGIPYDSEEAIRVAEELISFISGEARKASRQLAEKRGSFPNHHLSIFRDSGPMRNATVTSIAPTGSISTIADVSSGIEPLFSVGYLRNALDTTMLVVNPLFERMAKKRDFYSTDLIAQVVREGSLQENKHVPDDVRRIFLTAHDIEPQSHVRMQAVFQKQVDNAVSKTINLPESATVEQLRSVFLLAHSMKCKGITVYRYGSKKVQPLEFGAIDTSAFCGADLCDV
jgi:ribonucleoside-diphosphate reductase alpha chain